MQTWLRVVLYGLLIAVAFVSFHKSGISGLNESDWRNIFHSTLSLIFAIVIFDGAISIYELKKKESSKQRLSRALRPLFIRMHELWFSMAYHTMSGIMGDNKDVFSEEYKIEICKYLDLESPAPVLGGISWREYLFGSFEHFDKELNKLNMLAISIGWEQLETVLSKYLSNGFNENIKTYLYSPQSIPGGLEKHPYLSVLGHWGDHCIGEYITLIKNLNKILSESYSDTRVKKFDFFQHKRLARINEANGFGESRITTVPVKNL